MQFRDKDIEAFWIDPTSPPKRGPANSAFE